MIRKKIVNAINHLHFPLTNDFSEMLHCLAETYESSAIDEIVDQQNPPIVVAKGRLFVKVNNEYDRQHWVKVAEICHRQIHWEGRHFQDLMIDEGISESELDDLLKDIIIRWQPLI